MAVKWTLKEVLEAHDVSPYQLRKASGLSANTVYPMVRGHAKRVSLATLTRTLAALRQLTGKRFRVGDLLKDD